MIVSKSKKSPLFSSKVRFIHRISKFNVNAQKKKKEDESSSTRRGGTKYRAKGR